MDPLLPVEIFMIPRLQAIESLVSSVDPKTGLVSALGFISRDLFAITPDIREQCFFCMGSMGSVIPFALGLTLAAPDKRILALEGDGSLLMNAGSLVSVLRYGGPRLGIVLFDNRLYESTGGQVSQPEGFKLEEFCAGASLMTTVANSTDEVKDWMARIWPNCDQPAVLIIKTSPQKPSSRIPCNLSLIKSRFSDWLARGVAAVSEKPAEP